MLDDESDKNYIVKIFFFKSRTFILFSIHMCIENIINYAETVINDKLIYNKFFKDLFFKTILKSK